MLKHLAQAIYYLLLYFEAMAIASILVNIIFFNEYPYLFFKFSP